MNFLLLIFLPIHFFYHSTLVSHTRPFGVNAIILGHDSSKADLLAQDCFDGSGKELDKDSGGDSPKIFLMRASGQILHCRACAIGKVY